MREYIIICVYAFKYVHFLIIDILSGNIDLQLVHWKSLLT